MKWYINMKLSSKLLIGFIVVALIAGLVGVFGITSINSIAGMDKALYDENVMGILNISYLQQYFLKIRVEVRNLAVYIDKDKTTYYNNLEEEEKQMQHYLEEFEKTISAENNSAAREDYTQLTNLLGQYIAEVQKIVEASKAGESSAEIIALFEAAAPVSNQTSDMIDKIANSNRTMAGDKAAMNTKTANNAFYIMLGIILLAVIVSVILGLLIANVIGKPVKKLVKAANKLAVGDMDIDVAYDGKDELGNMVKAFEQVAERIFWYEGLLDSIPFPLSVTDSDMNWTFINKPVETMLGIKRRDVVGKQCSNWNANICKTEKCGIARLKNNQFQTLFDQQDMNYQVDTSYILNRKGEQVGHVEIVQDITAKTRSTQYLKSEVEKLQVGLNAIADGNLSADIKIGQGDEYTVTEKESFVNIYKSIDKLKRSIQSLSEEINSLIEASTEGNLSQRSNAQTFQGEWASLINGLNGLLDAVIEPVQEASSVLNEIASGNLQVAMMGDYKGDHAVIKDALNQTIYSLNEVLSNINQAADQVSSGAKQVSDSSFALSQGASEQASAVQQLTASMEEIAAQTTQNASNAGQANQLAETARTGALSGSDQMKDMVKAMGEINEASNNISKIIKVIDEIAFQTNILALNAAVEAARAGQHGKGFAVVAEEVRNLAARSADAAKETTVMIENSIKKVEDGTKILSETSKALTQIVDNVSKTSGLVAEIAVASKEQAMGISQINQGINQVSMVTQSNSATAEESAAASEELTGQAEVLKDMVKKFKLSENRSYYGSEPVNREVVRRERSSEEYRRPSGFGIAKNQAAPTKPRITLSDTNFGKY